MIYIFKFFLSSPLSSCDRNDESISAGRFWFADRQAPSTHARRRVEVRASMRILGKPIRVEMAKKNLLICEFVRKVTPLWVLFEEDFSLIFFLLYMCRNRSATMSKTHGLMLMRQSLRTQPRRTKSFFLTHPTSTSFSLSLTVHKIILEKFIN